MSAPLETVLPVGVVAAEPATPARPAEASRSPWDRYEWVMSTVWLIFLFFPIQAAVLADTDPVWRGLAVVGIVAFAAAYVVGFLRSGKAETWTEVTRIGRRHLAVMVALALLVSLVIGLEALGMATFVVAFAMFTLPLVGALVLGAVVLAVALLLPWWQGVLGELWGFIPLLIMVGTFTAIIRVIEDRQITHQAAQDELMLAAERDRVARDVHDVLGHSLTVVTVKAELAERLVDVDPQRAKAELAEIQSLTRQSLAEIRATVAGLRIARLTEEIETARSTLAAAGMEASLPQDPSVVEPRHRMTLAWALREAVTNAVRHSGARRCTVELGEDWLVVTDDGVGTRGRREGNGIRGLRERVTAAGGRVSIEAGPTGGTRLRVQL